MTHKETNTDERRISSTTSCTTPSRSTRKKHATPNQGNTSRRLFKTISCVL